MSAARFHAKLDVRIEDVEEPTPGPGQVKLRNAYAGICGSDLHVYYTPESSGLNYTRPHPLTGAMPPQILGHEFSGTVVELGEGATGVAVGDRVAVWPIYNCGTCAACRRGMVNTCRSLGFHGLSSYGGGMAEYTTVRASMLHRLPESVDLRLGALPEPMAVAWHAVEQSGIEPGQVALIAGAGPIGIGLSFALRARGIEVVLVSEPSPSRRVAMQRLGARRIVDPALDDLPRAVAEATAGAGVDVAFDAAGAGVATLQALRLLAPGGRLVVVALHEKGFEFNPGVLLFDERSITGTLAYLPRDFDAVIAAMAQGHYDTTGWVEEIDVDDLLDSFGRLRSGSAMKVLVRMH
jgi:(R,R)-butanediol dehydrogenase / meso-butanediol dehydrogenase / diacetyl reductase